MRNGACFSKTSFQKSLAFDPPICFAMPSKICSASFFRLSSAALDWPSFGSEHHEIFLLSLSVWPSAAVMMCREAVASSTSRSCKFDVACKSCSFRLVWHHQLLALVDQSAATALLHATNFHPMMSERISSQKRKGVPSVWFSMHFLAHEPFATAFSDAVSC
jgi:hypothetical protein